MMGAQGPRAYVVAGHAGVMSGTTDRPDRPEASSIRKRKDLLYHQFALLPSLTKSEEAASAVLRELRVSSVVHFWAARVGRRREKQGSLSVTRLQRLGG